MDLIKTAVRNHVFHLQIARPEKRNAINRQMYVELNQALDRAMADDDVRVLYLTGTAGSFCAGNDLSLFESLDTEDDDDPGLVFIRKWIDVDKPIVAAVDGPAVGLGATLLLHCDLVYATPSAFFQMPFVDLGLCPELGSTYLLPRMLGHGRAAPLLLLGERLSAQQWLELGLLTGVVEGSTCQDLAVAKAEMLAEKPVEALRVTRRLMRGDGLALGEAVSREVRTMGVLISQLQDRERR